MRSDSFLELLGEVREDPVAPADTGDKNVSARGLPLAEAFFCDRKWGYQKENERMFESTRAL